MPMIEDLAYDRRPSANCRILGRVEAADIVNYSILGRVEAANTANSFWPA